MKEKSVSEIAAQAKAAALELAHLSTDVKNAALMNMAL